MAALFELGCWQDLSVLHAEQIARLPPIESEAAVAREIEDLRRRVLELETNADAARSLEDPLEDTSVVPIEIDDSVNRGMQDIDLVGLMEPIGVGGYQVDIDGYVKLDVIHDFDAILSTDFFDTLTIPTDGRPGENTRLHARQTRLNLDVRNTHGCVDERLFIEGDFFGPGDSLRLRHAFLQHGGLLAGQTWTTFMDESILPRTLDFESPRSVILDRRGLLRYTHEVTDSLEWAVAIEDPQPFLDTDSAPPGSTERPAPDLISRVRCERSWGHLQAANFVRLLQYRTDGVGTDDELGWGFNFTGRVALRDVDSVIFQVAFGEGIGTFRQAPDAAVDSAGLIEAIPLIGWVVGYEINWTDRLFSTVVFSSGNATNADFQLADAPQASEYLATNLIFQATPRISYGAEYLFGTRTDQDGSDGEAHRVQFSVRYDLP